jgi:hypothetical protein
MRRKHGAFLSVVQPFNRSTVQRRKTQIDSSNRSRRSTNRSVAGSSGFNSPDDFVERCSFRAGDLEDAVSRRCARHIDENEGAKLDKRYIWEQKILELTAT